MQTYVLPKLRFDKSGTPYLKLRITSEEFFGFRTVAGEGRSVEEMQREAERYALERFPGLLIFKQCLPLGDCGHANL